MNGDLYRDLAWLPRQPGDFAARCQAVAASGEGSGRHIQWLASSALDENGLVRLSKLILRAQREGCPLVPLAPFRLGIVSDVTSNHLVPALIATAARYGFALDCIEAPYGQVMQEALSPDSTISRARPDAVLIALDHRSLPLACAPGEPEAAAAAVDATVAMIETIRKGIKDNCGALVILTSVAPPAETLFGSFDAVIAGSLRNLIHAVNRRVADTIAGSADLFFDVAGLAETVGLANWHDPTAWNIGKFPFSAVYLPLYADHVCRLIAASRGKARRCLILDLDNTLWSGVIGDDGLEGIVIGEGDPTGEAHLAVQKSALRLRERGIILAVSSKNDDDVARQPFTQHPDMALKLDHFAAFQANWTDKASNIRAIADELALGLESMVFLDDNPAERALVRDRLPEVAVPELPSDPALYARTLLAAGYFEAVTYSDEDRQRASLYEDNARRIMLQKQAGSLDDYLLSLEMVMQVKPFDEIGRARISQLINKSNQFNLTTRRYSEADVEAAERDPACFTLQVRLADRFGDNGMICVIVCRALNEKEWEIDSWLMSCRVLGRKVEEAVLQEIAFHARKSGITRLIGVYRPTSRNRMVAEHYAKLGFQLLENASDGGTRWALDLGELAAENLPMQVERLGFDLATV